MTTPLRYFTGVQALRAGHAAVLLDLIAKAWCVEYGVTVIPREAVGLCAGLAGLVGSDVARATESLVEADLWSHHPDGYLVGCDSAGSH